MAGDRLPPDDHLRPDPGPQPADQIVQRGVARQQLVDRAPGLQMPDPGAGMHRLALDDSHPQAAPPVGQPGTVAPQHPVDHARQGLFATEQMQRGQERRLGGRIAGARHQPGTHGMGIAHRLPNLQTGRRCGRD
ncbi:hypothetical protein [Sedimentitalea sp. HM32M-2]|uniref:hypothetical protein n=1 Tax=Sedimentitalea sp. HM32M-2 TaxID=3351566 RepID=UPI0036D3C329